MAERHEILKSRAISTLKNKKDRVSLFTDGYGDFCFKCKPFCCVDCLLNENHARFLRRPASPDHSSDLERAPIQEIAPLRLVILSSIRKRIKVNFKSLVLRFRS